MNIMDQIRDEINKCTNKAKLCRDSGISWRSLYRFISLTGNPRIKNIEKLLYAMNKQLKIDENE
jgi:DNA-binding phage protein